MYQNHDRLYKKSEQEKVIVVADNNVGKMSIIKTYTLTFEKFNASTKEKE